MAEQPPHEKLKSFDLLASVDMLQFDLQRFGQVLPETRERVCDEELSLMAEGAERAARTPFRLQRQAGELMYFDRGEYRPYIGMLLTGLEVAEHEAEADYRREFLYDWAVRDLAMGYKMQALRPGQQLVWHSAYPQEVEDRYGAVFLRSRGLFPHRKMGFIHRASCTADGSVTLESQTVDRSDDEAFAAVQEAALYDPAAAMDTLVRVYDGVLVQKHGGRFYAGRRGAEIGENAWEQINRHRDLIGYYLDELERLAASGLPRSDLEQAVAELTIGTWKAFKERLDGRAQPVAVADVAGVAYSAAYIRMQLADEVQTRYQQARAAGEIKVGCGGAVKAGDGIDEPVDGQGTFNAIFGTGEDNKSETYKFDRKMYCVVCQRPPEKGAEKKMCGPCGICRPCDTKLKTKTKGAYALAA